MQPFRVLSIDFDVFTDLPSKDYLQLYPDGIDVSTEISTIIWANAYANLPQTPSIKVQDIDCRKDQIDALYDLLQTCETDTPILITNSHVHCYDWILKHLPEDMSLHLTNLDMHHDILNDNETLDCGNWIHHVKEAVSKFQLTWVTHPFSKEIYGLQNDSFASVLTDIKDLPQEPFDLIFLCRSDPWLPPHLDHYFQDCIEFLRWNFSNILIEPSVKNPRDYQSATESINQALQSFYEKNE